MPTASPPPPPPPFDPSPILSYLSLPPSYIPSPSSQPLEFLRQHLPSLPASHAEAFSALLTPEERAQLPLVRNRRLAYALQSPTPSQLTWSHSAPLEPALWTLHGGPSLGIPLPKPGEAEAADERTWAEEEFVGRRGPEGTRRVGDMGGLLGEFERERVGERRGQERRERARRANEAARRACHDGRRGTGGNVLGGEREEDSDLGSMSEHETSSEDESASPEGVKRAFERAIRERFVVGKLEWAEYGCDWEDGWDGEWEREREGGWFDQDSGDEEEEEGEKGEEGTGVYDY